MNPKHGVIMRDYHTVFWLLPKVSTRDPIISPRAKTKALGLIMGSRVDTLGKNQNPVIICLSHIQIHPFNVFDVQKCE